MGVMFFGCAQAQDFGVPAISNYDVLVFDRFREEARKAVKDAQRQESLYKKNLATMSDVERAQRAADVLLKKAGQAQKHVLERARKKVREKQAQLVRDIMQVAPCLRTSY